MSARKVLSLLVILTPSLYLARAVSLQSAAVTEYRLDLNSLPGPAPEKDVVRDARWVLPEKFLPSMKMNEWITQSFQDVREVAGKKLKLIVLIDLRQVHLRGEMKGVQFRDPRILIEGAGRSVVIRHLDLVFNHKVLSAIETYRNLNLIVPEGEVVKLGVSEAQPLVILPTTGGANFMAVQMTDLEILETGGSVLMADRAPGY